MDNIAFPTLGAIAKRTLLRADLILSVRDAASLMDMKGVSSLVIEENNQKWIFSVEDMLDYVHKGGDCSVPLSSLLLHELGCLAEQERVLAALEYMEQHGMRYMGVTDSGGKLVGIVSYTDILASIDPAVLMERKAIGDLISRSLPVTFTADWTLEDVAHHLKKMEDAILIVESDRPIGIITTKDVFGILTSGKGMGETLGSYMISPVITTPRHFSISDALLQLKTSNTKRAIVVDEKNKLLGVVTQSELIGYAYGAWVNIMKNHTSELHELVGMLEEKNNKLERLSLTDELTGLGNRRLLCERMSEELERVTRYGAASCSLIIADIDYFKSVNDRFGHLAGDKVLVGIARLLESLIRRGDTAVRWGGEEFAILLSNTPLSLAQAFADRFRSSVEQLAIADTVSVTISMGVGEYVRQEGEENFFLRVDRALYRAKANGRNLVEISQF